MWAKMAEQGWLAIAIPEEQGGFKAVDELLEVKGIGAAALDRIRPFVAIQGKTSLSRK